LSKLEVELIGKEKEHYDVLEDLHTFAVGSSIELTQLAFRLRQTISDWERMMGGTKTIRQSSEKYVQAIEIGDRRAGRDLYLFLSPIFFFVLVLQKLAHKAWRDTVAYCGIFCERIVRNLLFEYDAAIGTRLFEDLKSAKQEERSGRLKSEFEKRGFPYASNLHGSLQRIYYMRNRRGPHDVQPPEPVQAKICLSECLPVYVDYIYALEDLELGLGIAAQGFMEIFSSMTSVQPNLLFGEQEGAIPPKAVIKDLLYRGGFFEGGKNLAEVMAELARRRYNYDKGTISNNLKNLCEGKDSILIRKAKNGAFSYYEHVPPSEYFRASV
jgi:hypothetical protein